MPLFKQIQGVWRTKVRGDLGVGRWEVVWVERGELAFGSRRKDGGRG